MQSHLLKSEHSVVSLIEKWELGSLNETDEVPVRLLGSGF